MQVGKFLNCKNAGLLTMWGPSDSQSVDLWMKDAQKYRSRLKTDVAEVEKYNSLSEFQNVSPLSTLDSKRKEKIATSKDVVRDIESLIHRCHVVDSLQTVDMTLPGCLLAYLLEASCINAHNNLEY